MGFQFIFYTKVHNESLTQVIASMDESPTVSVLKDRNMTMNPSITKSKESNLMDMFSPVHHKKSSKVQVKGTTTCGFC